MCMNIIGGTRTYIARENKKKGNAGRVHFREYGEGLGMRLCLYH